MQDQPRVPLHAARRETDLRPDEIRQNSPQKPRSVDLSAYPDLVVVYLGYRVSGWRSFWALSRIAPHLRRFSKTKPDGLLAHETVVFGLNHIGMRQYWRDFESLETFTRSDPHRGWWRDFSRDNKGAGFWHEAYRRAGGIEGLYINMPRQGLASFAPDLQPDGPFLSSRQRLAA